MEKAEIGNKEILVRMVRKEFLASAFTAFGITFFIYVVPLQAVKEVLANTEHFSSLVVQSVIGIAALMATIVVSDLLQAEGNRHLINDWEFRTRITKTVFISFVVTFLAFALPFSETFSKYGSCFEYLASWLTITAVTLTLLGFWYAITLIKRVVGYSKEHE